MNKEENLSLRDNKEFEKDLKDFANKFRVTIAEHSLKTSGYFEISCYNLILRYYEKKGYTLEVMNLQSDGFKFKCGPHGYISNFSYFKATKGKRIFKMAPIHHHFELCDWTETKVVNVFSIITAAIAMVLLFDLD